MVLENHRTEETTADLVVRARTDVADGVVHLRLERPDGADLPPWEPGAHVDLELTPDLVRQYSLCGRPDDLAGLDIAVLREPESRGGSQFVADKLTTDAMVTVRGPRNHFPLQAAPAYRFIAGGIGITPMIPMIAAAERAGADWQLLYGGRTLPSMAFADQLQEQYSDRVLLRPQDEYGLLDLGGFLADLPVEGRVYCCGPEPLLQAVTAIGERWPAGTVRMERFAAREPDADAVDTTFEVELAQMGTTVVVPSDRSILDVVEEAGAFVMSSCAEGTCGSCETTVLAGEPEHRDSVLDDTARAAGDTMMICVSRCRGDRLVLDL